MVDQLSSRLAPLLIFTVSVVLAGCTNEPANVNWPKVEVESSRDKVLLKANYLVKIKGYTVGYVLLDAKQDEKADEVYGIWFMTMQLNRGAETNASLLDVHFVESMDGALKSMTVDSNQGGAAATFAVVAGDSLEVRVEKSDEVVEKQLPWQPGTLGPLGIDLSLARDMMKPGETRSLSNVEPTNLAIYKQTLRAQDYEVLEDFPEQSLLKIDVLSDGEGVSLEGKLWVNSEGVTMKATYPQMGMEFLYVKDRMEATGTFLESSTTIETVDFNEVTSVEIEGIYDQEASRQELTLSSALTDLSDIFPNTLSQIVKKKSKNKVVLELSDDISNPDILAENPSKEFLASSILIEVEHAGIRAKVEELTNGLENEVEKLKVIQKFVYEHMEEKNYSKAMASAADAFESGEGDCTEHACLLAAMMRAAGLPTRMVNGLVAVPDGALTNCWFHMWNEVYLDDRWVSVDATRASDRVKWSRYIKIADSSLSDENDQGFLLAGMVLLGDLSVSCR